MSYITRKDGNEGLAGDRMARTCFVVPPPNATLLLPALATAASGALQAVGDH